jgi:hypothetical protein
VSDAAYWLAASDQGTIVALSSTTVGGVPPGKSFLYD